jgi:hypothetical protein
MGHIQHGMRYQRLIQLATTWPSAGKQNVHDANSNPNPSIATQYIYAGLIRPSTHPHYETVAPLSVCGSRTAAPLRQSGAASVSVGLSQHTQESSGRCNSSHHSAVQKTSCRLVVAQEEGTRKTPMNQRTKQITKQTKPTQRTCMASCGIA